MTELLLIRHGETAWNTAQKLQGHADIPLNAEGTRQAKALASHLQNEKLHAIISSDLHRAVQTASEIARLQGISTRIDSQLRERCFGGFEGIAKAELAHHYPTEYAQWRSRDPDFHFPAPEGKPNYIGESTREFHHRIITAVNHYAYQFEGKKIAIVTHGGVLECVYRQAHHLPLNAERKVTLYNASINRFEAQNGALRLLNWGEITHLQIELLDELSY